MFSGLFRFPYTVVQALLLGDILYYWLPMLVNITPHRRNIHVLECITSHLYTTTRLHQYVCPTQHNTTRYKGKHLDTTQHDTQTNQGNTTQRQDKTTRRITKQQTQ